MFLSKNYALLKVLSVFLCRKPSSNALWRRDFCNEVRTRFAPSPTGELHLGGLRTALFNYIFAKANQGVFILRIEDTDIERSVEQSTKEISLILNEVGLSPDEGPQSSEGPHAPYVQSQRLEIYKRYANHLIKSGKAYRCFCTTEKLKFLKLTHNFSYDGTCKLLSPEDIAKNLKENMEFCVRICLYPDKTSFNDMIFGKQENVSKELDPIILKSNGYPVSHFSCVIDDHLMRISHVIRGSEWISSTPKQLHICRTLDFKEPIHAHIPLLFNETGKKLSKRNIDLSIKHLLHHTGCFPISIMNFFFHHGYTQKFDKQILSLSQMCSTFQLEKISKCFTKVDPKFIETLNKWYLADMKSEETLHEKKLYMLSFLKNHHSDLIDNRLVDEEYILKTFDWLIYRDRISSLKNLTSFAYLWNSSHLTRLNCLNEDDAEFIESLLAHCNKFRELTCDSVMTIAKNLASSHELKSYSFYLMRLRFYLTGNQHGPSILHLLEIMTFDRILVNLNFCYKQISSGSICHTS